MRNKRSLYSRFFYGFVLAFVQISCGSKSPVFSIVEHQTLRNVPSASGMAVLGGKIYMVGDNTPYLYQLNQTYQVTSRTPLFSADLQQDTIIPKSDKPDLEALEVINHAGVCELIVFGSGSKSPQRDILVHINPIESKVRAYSLTRFYDTIRRIPALEGHELNIEAVAVDVDKDRLLLFNRGKNLILLYSFNDWMKALQNEQIYPEAQVFEVVLPTIEGIVAGFSGATIIPGSNKLIFTASVEDTPNAIADGEILGSFIGVFEFNDLKDQLTPDCILITENEEPVKIKIESVAVPFSASDDTEILLVSDSDGGHSEILKGILRWN